MSNTRERQYPESEQGRFSYQMDSLRQKIDAAFVVDDTEDISVKNSLRTQFAQLRQSNPALFKTYINESLGDESPSHKEPVIDHPVSSEADYDDIRDLKALSIGRALMERLEQGVPDNGTDLARRMRHQVVGDIVDTTLMQLDDVLY